MISTLFGCHIAWWLRACLVFVSQMSPLQAELRLPRVFSDHLVLQAGPPAACWGWADPGATIAVRFVSSAAHAAPVQTATVGADRRWRLRLPPLAAGQAGTFEISSSSGEKKTVADVLVGEVWFGSGQSNMSYRLDAKNAPSEIMRTAQHESAERRPALRFFMTDRKGSDTALDDVAGAWVVAAPENVGKCSAVAWNFGVALRRELHVPVGLIVSAVGGTPVEAWISRSAFDATQVGPAIWARHHAAIAGYSPAVEQRHKALDQAWLAAYPTPESRVANRDSRPRPPYTPENNYIPTRFYNGMVHGLVPYTVRGFLWFQADGNNRQPAEYPELIRRLITSWREQWGAELPFYYVEMNNMQAAQSNPVELAPLCLIREAQTAALALPKTGVVASIDLGEEDAHFANKKPVGERLVGLALAEDYDRPGPVRSPEYRSSEFLPDGRVRIAVRYGDGLQVADGGEVRGFAIRSAEGPWVWGRAKLEGESVLVWSEQVKTPVAVRYAWARNPVISLINGARLPLRPFRTDTQSPE